MIRLNVEEYCHTCNNFSPTYDQPTICYGDGQEYHRTDGIITCEHRKICSNIVRYLSRKIKEKEE